jgi:hypothetical protein
MPEGVAANGGEARGTVTLLDVPVDAVRSVTIYSACSGRNDLGRRRRNDHTATPNEEGSIILGLGGCDDGRTDGRTDCLPLARGWNDAARLSEPHPEVLDGSWTFPPIKPRT